MYTRIALIVLVCAALVSCGGGHAPTDQLFTLNADNRWVYRFTGSVTLPASRGGGTETVRADQSTLTFQVLRETAKDAQGADVGLLDRTFHLVLLDGRSVDGVLRLYFSQTAQGIYVHGVQTFVGEPAGSPTWVPLTAAPPYQFLYLPNPAGDGSALGYGQPFGTALNGGYALGIYGPRKMVTVPAGTFSAKQIAFNEAFDSFTLTYGSPTTVNFSPEWGILSGNITATLPDGSAVSGSIVLLSRS